MLEGGEGPSRRPYDPGCITRNVMVEGKAKAGDTPPVLDGLSNSDASTPDHQHANLSSHI